MDKNQLTGVVVMLVLMTVYFWFFSEKQEIPQEVTTEEVATEETKKETISQKDQPILNQPSNDSLASAQQKERFGLFAAFANGEEETITLENEVMKMKLSSKGGLVKEVELKEFKTFDQKPLILFDEKSANQDFIVTSNYRPVNLSELYFNLKKGKTSVEGTDTTSVSYKIAFEEGKYIEHKYTLGGTGYEVLYELNFVGMEGIVDNQDVVLNWSDDVKRLEANFKESKQETQINYKKLGGDFDYMGDSPSEGEVEEINETIHWFTFNQRFFSAGLIANNGMKSGKFQTSVNENDSLIIKSTAASLTLNSEDLRSGKGNFKYYFGPNNYQITKKVVPGFEENVDLGWKVFRFVNKWLIIPIFNFLENYIASYGIIIIILVFAVRLILAPMTYTSHMSMAKMKVLKPEMDAIKEEGEKKGHDQTKIQQETMALYRKAGVNPLSGCIPLLLQMPFLLAMFNFFPNSIELRQESFLWAHDLSTYDSVLDLPFEIPFYGSHVSLFTLLMTASTILITWSNSQMTTQMQGPMKSMQYMMPVMFMFILNSFSAGLTFYYFVSNIVSFGQIALFRKIVNEDKIKKLMEENRKKNANKKKSKFQQKLEDAMKSAEEQRKSKPKGKKKK